MKLEEFVCVDSIPQFTNDVRIKTPMVYARGTEDKLDKLCANNNIRKDAHVIIFNKRLEQTDPAELKRLQDLKIELDNAIKANGAIWNLTNSQEEKNERKKQNDYNRSKLATVESMI
jgi:hypothetical protein